eukprot:Phypoly_transcript_14255.p1 GENE.Phypoly_transcript_14255~~Phypoly_transcript_14255.p1  ORF type:complete len:192 (+),score=40.41 Phypoly_transcript_14255:149-724(+)
MEIFNPTEKLELLAASASEIHAASERGKLRVEFKSDEDRTKKRQLRLLKNRQSAALSRQRKKEYITDLEERTNGLITENHELVQKIAFLSSVNVECKMHIETLEKILSETRNENNELKSRLASITTTSTPSTSTASTATTSTTTTSTSTATTTSTTSTNVPTAEKEDTHMSSPPPTSSPTLVQQPQPSSNP